MRTLIHSRSAESHSHRLDRHDSCRHHDLMNVECCTEDLRKSRISEMMNGKVCYFLWELTIYTVNLGTFTKDGNDLCANTTKIQFFLQIHPHSAQ